MITELTISTKGQGLHEFTDEARDIVAKSRVSEGLCTLFIRHTSASLMIQENADPSARHDLEAWLNRLVPDSDPHYTHTSEGHDDMPAHIKASLTAVSLSIPIINNDLALGRWQGIYLWEHRHASHQRKVLISIIG